jgi:ferritin-like metal-binding protein YciE
VTLAPALRLAGDGTVRTDPLRRLLLQQVVQMHAAEREALQVLGELAASARSPRLALLLRMHVAETREHVGRLRAILDRHGLLSGTLGSRGKRGLLEDCIELACREDAEAAVRDAALAAVALHLEHDEIASYQVMRLWAVQLGMHEEAATLAMNMSVEQRLVGRLLRWSACGAPEEAAGREMATR